MMEFPISKGEVMFDLKKAAHVAAYLLWKGGGEMSSLKLMNLMYLAEKQFLLQHDERLTGDAMVSMPKGPVLSGVCDCFMGGHEYWCSWVKNPRNYNLALGDTIKVNQEDPLDTFDELSLADQKTLDAVYAEFGSMNCWQLGRLLRDPGFCPEWEDPQGSSSPIPPSALLIKNGKTEAQVDAILLKLAEEDDLLTVTRDAERQALHQCRYNSASLDRESAVNPRTIGIKFKAQDDHRNAPTIVKRAGRK